MPRVLLTLCILALGLQASSSAHEVPNEVTVSGVPQAGRPDPALPGPRADGLAARHQHPCQGRGVPRYRPRGCGAPRRRHALDLRFRRALRKRREAAEADGPGRQGGTALQPRVRQLRRGPGQRPRAAPARRHDPLLGTGVLDVLFEYPIALRRLPICHPSRFHPSRPSGERRPPVARAGQARTGVRRARRRGHGGARPEPGTKPRGCSSRKASGTSSTARTTCCSCSAWSCPSADFGRSWSWSPPSPSPTR